MRRLPNGKRLACVQSSGLARKIEEAGKLAVDTRALREECEELSALLLSLPHADWARMTAFYGWTVADQVMHLHQTDGFGLVALSEPDDFPGDVAKVREHQAQGIELSQRMRELWGALPPGELAALWQTGWQQLADLLDAADPETRLPWFGPPMKAQSFANARQMEIWAHGQDVYDLLRIQRPENHRIRTICDLGVRTQGWSFANRRLERPKAPEVTLMAPSGAHWSWNSGAAERISGPAEDFALVVTQRRHIEDTALVVDGQGAKAWMRIAQCFAGEAADGPAPGVRLLR